MGMKEKRCQIFSNNLCKLLDEKGYTQADMAHYMGVTTSSAWAWMHGANVPRLTKIQKLATWLGTTPNFLIGEQDEQGELKIRPIDNLLKEMFSDNPDIMKALTSGSYAEKQIRTDDGAVYDISDTDLATIKNVITLVMKRRETRVTDE